MVVISNGIAVQASRFDVGGGKEREVQSSVLLCRKTSWEKKIYSRCKRKTKETTCMSRVREGNKYRQ